MRKRVWTFQQKKDVERKGANRASWFVGWYDLDGRRRCEWYDLDGRRRCESCGPGARGQREAERRKRKIEAELLTGTHEPGGRVTWSRFRTEYEAKILPRLAPRSQQQVKTALDHFERIVKPGRMDRIRTDTIGGSARYSP